MTDIEKALKRWSEYGLANVAMPWIIPEHFGIASEGELVIADDHCTGWAHRELKRRGCVIRLFDGTQCRVIVWQGNKHLSFKNNTLLDCYLDAIQATEPNNA